MTALERLWRDALLHAMIPSVPGGRLPDFRTLDLSVFWLRYQKSAPLFLRLGFRVAVLVLTWMPLLSAGRPFFRLSPDRQDAFLQRMARSRSYLMRQLVTVVKLMACFAYFFDSGVQQSVREPPLLTGLR